MVHITYCTLNGKQLGFFGGCLFAAEKSCKHSADILPSGQNCPQTVYNLHIQEMVSNINFFFGVMSLMNVSSISNLLLALFWSSPSLEGNVSLFNKILHRVHRRVTNCVCLPFGAGQVVSTGRKKLPKQLSAASGNEVEMSGEPIKIQTVKPKQWNTLKYFIELGKVLSMVITDLVFITMSNTSPNTHRHLTKILIIAALCFPQI